MRLVDFLFCVSIYIHLYAMGVGKGMGMEWCFCPYYIYIPTSPKRHPPTGSNQFIEFIRRFVILVSDLSTSSSSSPFFPRLGWLVKFFEAIYFSFGQCDYLWILVLASAVFSLACVVCFYDGG